MNSSMDPNNSQQPGKKSKGGETITPTDTSTDTSTNAPTELTFAQQLQAEYGRARAEILHARALARAEHDHAIRPAPTAGFDIPTTVTSTLTTVTTGKRKNPEWKHHANLEPIVSAIIIRLLRKRPNAPKEWKAKIPHIAKKLAICLLEFANTEEEFFDVSTLNARLHALAENVCSGRRTVHAIKNASGGANAAAMTNAATTANDTVAAMENTTVAAMTNVATTANDTVKSMENVAATRTCIRTTICATISAEGGARMTVSRTIARIAAKGTNESISSNEPSMESTLLDGSAESNDHAMLLSCLTDLSLNDNDEAAKKL